MAAAVETRSDADTRAEPATRPAAGTQPDGQTSPKVAVVLSGAAARGAFQAGALAELLPVITAEPVAPILLGTSAGAINAALYAALIHRGPAHVAKQLEALWGRVSHADVYRPLLASSPVTAVQFAAGALLGVGGGTPSLLDTEPLRETADAELDTAQLEHNVRSGRVAKLGVTATRVPPAAANTIPGTSSGHTVIFLDEHEPTGFSGDPERAQTVARGPIGVEHVIASAAIPIAFPAQRITRPAEATGWYVDGGIRLNAPLRPAIALGATKLIVISATSTTYAAELPPDTGDAMPDAADAGAQVLSAVLADRLTEDLLTLQLTNRLLADVERATGGADSVLRSNSGRPFRTIEFISVSPPPGGLGRLADRVFERKTRGWGALTETDNWLLGRALRGAGDATGRRELLSYLLFDEDYFAESFALGRQVAAEAVARSWRT